MKKILFLTGIGFLGFALRDNGNLKTDSNESPLFINQIQSSKIGLSDGRTQGISYDSNGDVVIGSGTGDFLSVGTYNREQNNYSYKKYEVGFGNTGFISRISFKNDGSVIAVSVADSGKNSGLYVGKKGSDGNYVFSNITFQNTVFFGNGSDVAFAPNGDLGYTSNGGGLIILHQNNNGGYDNNNFTPYISGKTPNLKSPFAAAVAFDSNNNVLYGTNYDEDDGNIYAGIYYGILGPDKQYSFSSDNYYSYSNNPYIKSKSLVDLAVSKDGLVAGCFEGDSNKAESGGLSLGKIEDNKIVFTNYYGHEENVSWEGTSVSFSNTGEICFTGLSEFANIPAISIGNKNLNGNYMFNFLSTGNNTDQTKVYNSAYNPTTKGFATDGAKGITTGNYLNADLIYDSAVIENKVNKYSLGLKINFTVPFDALIKNNPGNYIKIVLSNDSNSKICAIYISNNKKITSTGYDQVIQNNMNSLPSDSQIQLEGIIGKDGLEYGKYKLTTTLNTTENNGKFISENDLNINGKPNGGGNNGNHGGNLSKTNKSIIVAVSTVSALLLLGFLGFLLFRKNKKMQMYFSKAKSHLPKVKIHFSKIKSSMHKIVNKNKKNK